MVNSSTPELIAESFARSRVYDAEDDPYRIRVDLTLAFVTNRSVLGEGTQCPPTWAFRDFSCFYYLGIPMTYKEAHQFCWAELGAMLASSRNRVSWLSNLMSMWQHNYEWINRYVWVSRAWIYSDVPMVNGCPVATHGWLEPYECHKRVGFFCQKTPYGVYAGVQREVIIGTCAILTIVLALVGCFLAGWFVKSRRRRAQRILDKQEHEQWLFEQDKVRQSCYDRVLKSDPSMDIVSHDRTSTSRFTANRLHLSRETLNPEQSRQYRSGQDVRGSLLSHYRRPRGSVSTLTSGRSPWLNQENLINPPAPPPLTRSLMNLGGGQLGVGMKVDYNSVRSGSQTQLSSSSFAMTRGADERIQHGLPERDGDSSDDSIPSTHIYQNQPLLGKTLNQYNSYADELNRTEDSTADRHIRPGWSSNKRRGVHLAKSASTHPGMGTFFNLDQRRHSRTNGAQSRGSLSPQSEEYDDEDTDW